MNNELFTRTVNHTVLPGGVQTSQAAIGNRLRVTSALRNFQLSLDGNNWVDAWPGIKINTAPFLFDNIHFRDPSGNGATIAFEYGTVEVTALENQAFPPFVKEHPTITIGGQLSLANNSSQDLNPWTAPGFFAASTYAALFVTSPNTSRYQQCEVRVSNTDATKPLIITGRGGANLIQVPALQERVVRTRSQLTVTNSSGGAVLFYAAVTFYDLNFYNWFITLA